jgi:glycosyltransferase involved in cell wall biosynthesis
MKNLLVSIIIPVFNRATLIGATLDSVLQQSYKNWECIIVDDGSTDKTKEVVGGYVKKDPRFKLFERSTAHLPGGSGARNYGFELANGDLILWFDSDDIMHKDNLALRIDILIKERCDFVVSKSINWFPEENRFEEVNYETNGIYPLNEDSFATQKVFWMTPDFICKKEFLINVSWNESLRSGQDYNFFVNFFAENYNSRGFFLNKYLVDYRKEHGSIQSFLKDNSNSYRSGKFKTYFITYLDVKNKYDKKVVRYILFRALAYYPNQESEKRLYSAIMYEYGISIFLLFILYVIVYSLNRRGYRIYLIIKNRILKML